MRLDHFAKAEDWAPLVVGKAQRRPTSSGGDDKDGAAVEEEEENEEEEEENAEAGEEQGRDDLVVYAVPFAPLWMEQELVAGGTF